MCLVSLSDYLRDWLRGAQARAVEQDDTRRALLLFCYVLLYLLVVNDYKIFR